MSATEVLAILVLVGWAIYRQTRASEVTAESRFKMAIIYAIVGICVGGFDRPSGLAGYGMIAIGLALSLAVGLARGRLTRVWADAQDVSSLRAPPSPSACSSGSSRSSSGLASSPGSPTSTTAPGSARS